MSRYILIGDVHGNYNGVNKLLDIVSFKPSTDILIFVGDYIDHQKLNDYSSKNTIDLLLNLKNQSNNIYFLMGNHDLWLREWLCKNEFINPIWKKQGAIETFRSYGINNLDDAKNQIDKFPDSHIDFFKNIIQDYYYDENLVAIHGGFTNASQMHTISKKEKLPYEQLYQMIWDRRFIFTKLEEEKKVFKNYFGERYLIVGHTPYGPYQNKLNEKWFLIDGNSKNGKKQLGLILDNNQSFFVNEDGYI